MRISSDWKREELMKSLPKYLRRDIKPHLCLNLVRRVPLFANMDEQLLDAICERLKSGLCTKGTCAVQEGDPVDEMLLIIRGSKESVTTVGGRTGLQPRFAKRRRFLWRGASYMGIGPEIFN